MNIIRSSFYPVTEVEKLSNVKRYYRVDSEKIVERILLDIAESALREQLIFLHFMKTYARLSNGSPMGIKVISRDLPWDFKIELSTGEELNIEITSIADSTDTFRKIKNEERYSLNTNDENIPLHELEKINKLFPEEEIEKLIAEYKSNEIPKDTIVKNPYYRNGAKIFLSTKAEGKTPIEDLIRQAVESKEAKRHSEKENTILIIDNRTLSYEYDELHESTIALQDFYSKSPFKEIWFYTGYGSDIDGNNAEFSLVPLKLTDEHEKMLVEVMSENPPDDNGLIIF